MIELDTLNPEQRDAVTHYKGPVMILAGAGTGKTRVVSSRIAYMLAKGVVPRSIVAMTFTNKAAKEMQDRIGGLVGSDVAKKINISTFHSFCLKLLRTWPKIFDLDPKFSLIGTGDQLDLVRRALEEKHWQGLYRAEDLHYHIGQCKNAMIGPQEVDRYEPASEFVDKELLSIIYELYERQLHLNRAIDFDDCIFKIVRALEANSNFSDKLKESYKYFLVDEFQDTNESQFSVLESLASEHANICVVGDDDQSIYSWRGAKYETLEKFEKVFSGTKVVKLEQNYRCSNVILNAANEVIRNNTKRKQKKLWSQSTEQKPIIVASFSTPTEEARWVAEKCLSLLGRGSLPSDIVILYRANNQSKLLEMALKEANLFFKTFGGQSFFERKEVKDFLSYLKVVVNPTDKLAFWRIINSPNRGIGLKSQEKIESLALKYKISPFEVITGELYLKELRNLGSFAAIVDFAKLIKQFMEMPLKTPQDAADLGTALLNKARLLENCKNNTKNIAAQQHKLSNLKSLPKWLYRTVEDAIKSKGLVNIMELFDSITIGAEERFTQEKENSQHISLMTIHAAKGLEFANVFLVGLEEGSLPHKNSLLNAFQVCEERRLFYVALTRAKKELFLSFAETKQIGFQKEACSQSRFLLELPETYNQIQIVENDNLKRVKNQEDIKGQTIKKLSFLRQQLQKDTWD